MRVTAEALKNATIRPIAFIEGEDFYRQVYRCDQFPELTKIVEGPRKQWSQVARATRWLVGSKPVAWGDWDGIAAEINRQRKAAADAHGAGLQRE
jgi:hypothetical protein